MCTSACCVFPAAHHRGAPPKTAYVCALIIVSRRVTPSEVRHRNTGDREAQSASSAAAATCLWTTTTAPPDRALCPDADVAVAVALEAVPAKPPFAHC
jgi:hypothetical protein